MENLIYNFLKHLIHSDYPSTNQANKIINMVKII